ncbi:SusC/RagA family TonB-linked outer membrane protein [Maribacter sp. X9]|uniref:SusC/RagA family TonB-linked outer membrane protein n=1 Tax=Maribacter sp. X9 TaxID=3402159 RepID=UPI003AF3B46C
MKQKFLGMLTLLFVLFINFSFAQDKTVTGVVTDQGGLPLPGVSVVVVGTTDGTQTDFDGNYTINVNQGQTLRFSYLGQKTITKNVGVGNSINVQMEEDAQALDEVVVVGYGVQKRKEITGSISSVSGSAIQGLVTPSFESQLAGRAAGVQVTSNTGIIGEAPSIRIRGVASIGSGTSPLIVVDGMPIISGDVGGYASANGLGAINPNDIESFEVLKDGAATAIYGSRAANGVILITTKKGKKGSMQVGYNVVTGFASAIKTFDLLNTEEFLEIANEKRTNRGQDPWAFGSEFDTDWQKAVLNSSALQMDHSLSVNGGTDKTRYYMSLGFTDQNGVAVSNSMKRHSIRTNIEHDVNKWLTIGANVGVTRTQYDGLNTGSGSLSGNIFNATRQLPNTPIFNPNHPTGYNISEDGSVVGRWDNTSPVGDNISNIGYVLANNKFQSKENRTLVNTFADVKLLKGLNYRFQASADNAITSGFLYYSPVHGDGAGANGRLQNSNTETLRWNTQNILNYSTSINDAHNVAATAVAEYQKNKYQNFFGTGTDLLDEFYNKNLVTGAYGTQTSGGSVTENGISSYVGRLSYNFRERYFLQGSIRRDGISKLSEATRWNNFTGYSAGWNIANERFFENLKSTISLFKIRGSYSEVGNTDIGNYPYLGLTSASPYGTLNGIAFTQFGNDQLRWETSQKIDYGLDLSLFANKLTFNFDYYKNDIDGLILDVPVPHSLGVPDNRIKKNIGALVNEGYEFTLNYTPFSTQKFNWNVSANLTLNKNTVTRIPDGQDIIGGTSTNTNIAPNLIIREGESINSLYGYRYWGVNPNNGNPVYYKADGSLVQGNLETQSYSVFDPANPGDTSQDSSLSSADDKFILGSSLPTYYGSLINRFNYGGFDLTFMFRYSGGNKVFNSTRRELVTQNLNNNSTEILGRWQSSENPGDGVTPRLYASSNTFTNLTGHASTRFLEKGDFISLDNVTLGYKLPTITTDKLNIKEVRFFVQAQNFVTITNYKGLNPEMESNGVDINGTPRTKVLSLGLNVKL